jgi:2-methylcitrate dehydratase PrpD
MATINVIPDDKIEALLPETMVIRVIAPAKDGTSYSTEVMNPLGHQDNPMDDPHIDQHFLTFAAPVLGKECDREALNAWCHVDNAAAVSQLLSLLNL